MGSPMHSMWAIMARTRVSATVCRYFAGLLRSEMGYAWRVIYDLVDTLMTIVRLVCKCTLRTYG